MNLQNEFGFTALLSASLNGYSNIVNELLKCKKIDVHLQDNDGFTALDKAKLNKNFESVKFLVKFISEPIKKMLNDIDYDDEQIPIELIDLIIEFHNIKYQSLYHLMSRSR